MSIAKHLPQREEVVPLQVRIPESLREAVEQARQEDGYTLSDIVVAGLKQYLEERASVRRKRG